MTTIGSHTKVPASVLQGFADIYDLLAAQWVSFGSVAWSSTGSAPSIGNGSLTANYLAFSHTVLTFTRLVWGSTTAGGTGDWRFTLPFDMNNDNYYIGGVGFDTSATAYYPLACYCNNTTPHIEAIGTYTSAGVLGRVTATHPVTWASGDVLTFVGVYQK